MTEESFNKAPGSELSRNLVTMGNVRMSPTTSPVPSPLERFFNPSDLPYTVLQYGHMLTTLVHPGYSVFPPPPPPAPVTIPVFYQPINGNLTQPQTFDENMFYRYFPQMNYRNEQKVGLPRSVGKTGQNRMKLNEPLIENRKPGSTKKDGDNIASAGTIPFLQDSHRGMRFGGAGGIPLNQEKVAVLIDMAMQGCEMAEQLAHSHQKRPCFKKIDSLCARMKQDLIRPDNVLANINSQGVAWAVKDFIFVFTRIMNAWIIIKGYVYNTPEGLERMQKEFSPDFLENFLKWQDSTIDFVDSLIKSFGNLDLLEQNQRTNGAHKESSSKTAGNRRSKTDEEKERSIHELYEYLKDIIPNSSDIKVASSSGNASSSDLSDRSNIVYDSTKSYPSSTVNDCEQPQIKHNENGAYLKTGIYETAKKPLTFGPNTNMGATKIPFTSTPKILKNPIPHDRPDILEALCNVRHDADDSIHRANEATNIALGSRLQLDFFNDAIIRYSYDSETVAKIHFLLQKVFSFNETKYFLNAQFTKNYFPDFLTINPNFVDIKTIISKTQIGGYQSIHDIVNALRQIVRAARRYLEKNSHPLMRETADEFERNLEDILNDKMFDCDGFNRNPGQTSPNVSTDSNHSDSNSGSTKS
ncbi:protein mitoshell isoform X3 [Toxorhynchites rutilus septentrionalis]|uniref:protein mitoshell isoform X3 n=1 Tax=Toxorhynchites rutilus septentrionalis TaxID=329112 RepID=UPI00247AB21C|nr:protein mitoshell isoform X3 [Toxorhynchites rutilus septentrionalis]